MSEITHISWADATWPVTVGCAKVSAGCSNCYAMRDARRLAENPHQAVSTTYRGLVKKQANGLLNWTGEVKELAERLDWPGKWRTHRDIFVCSQSDLLHEGISDEFIGRVFSVMRNNPQHTYYVLTKRPERLLQLAQASSMHTGEAFDGMRLPHVLFGVSAEDQKAADERIPLLVQVPLASTQRFVSAEPLLGPLDLSAWINEIGWVIAGGESGTHAHPMHPDWARVLRDQCKQARIAFHFKQWGEWSMQPPATAYPEARNEHGTLVYRLRKHARKAVPTCTMNERTFYRVGRKQAGRILDGQYWDARPGRDTGPIYAPHPLGQNATVNEYAHDYQGLTGTITAFVPDDPERIDLDGEEGVYYLSLDGEELPQALSYWQLDMLDTVVAS